MKTNLTPWRSHGIPVTAPLRRALVVTSTVALIGMVALLVVGLDGAIYAALAGEPLSLATLLQHAPKWICGMLRACSA